MKDESLVSVVCKNMAKIVDVLGIDVNNEPCNYFVVMHHFNPHLKSLASNYKSPCCAVFSKVHKKALKSADLLERMGFLDKAYNAYAPTMAGASLFEAYHKVNTPSYKTRAEMIEMLLNSSESF